MRAITLHRLMLWCGGFSFGCAITGAIIWATSGGGAPLVIVGAAIAGTALTLRGLDERRD